MPPRPRCVPTSPTRATSAALCSALWPPEPGGTPGPGPSRRRLGQPRLQSGNLDASLSPATALFVFPSAGRPTGQRGTDQPGAACSSTQKAKCGQTAPRAPHSSSLKSQRRCNDSLISPFPLICRRQVTTAAGPPRRPPPAGQHATGGKRAGSRSLGTENSPGSPLERGSAPPSGQRGQVEEDSPEQLVPRGHGTPTGTADSWRAGRANTGTPRLSEGREPPWARACSTAPRPGLLVLRGLLPHDTHARVCCRVNATISCEGLSTTTHKTTSLREPRNPASSSPGDRSPFLLTRRNCP